MTAILTWLGAKRWLLELIGAVLLILLAWWWHSHVYDSGITAQQQVDAARLTKAVAAADAKTLAAQQKADKAEVAHAQEIASISAYLAAAPPAAVRLCQPAPDSRPMSQTGTLVGGITPVGTPPAGVPGMPAGDSGVGTSREVGPDIGAALRRLAAAGDVLSAAVREFQTRK